MVTLKSKEEIEILREGGRRHAQILAEIKKNIKPGVSAKELDDLAFRLVKEDGDQPAFLNYQPEGAKYPYPASLCFSINEEIVHGLPLPEKVLKEGDIVTIDLGLTHKGLITDSALTAGVGKIDKLSEKLLSATRLCLEKGIGAARAGNFIGDIGFAVEKEARYHGFALAENLAGHGVGYKVHEDPYVPNQGRKGEGLKLEIGMVLAIEPMLCLGDGKIFLERDGFTIRTKDRKRSAHFEHTIAITEKGPVVLTKI